MSLQKNRPTNRNSTALTNRLTNVLFIIYLVAVFWIILFKLGVPFSYMGDKRSINLVPFGKPLVLNGKADYGEIILNVIIFIPLGIYAGILFKRWTFGKQLLLFFLISLMLEVLQYLFKLGASDITDVITNTSGGIIGLIIFTIIEKVFNNSVKAQQFINIIAATGTVIMIVLLILLKMNMLPVRYQ